MKIQNKNRMIVLFAVMSMLLMIVPSSNVLATSYTTPIGFNDGVVGSEYANSFLKTNYINATNINFAVSDINKRSGSKSFRDNYNAGWWNLSYDKSDYLTCIKLYINKTTSAYSSTGNNSIFFYNATRQNYYPAHWHNVMNGSYVIAIRQKDSAIQYLNSVNVWSTWTNWGVSNVYHLLNITINDNTGMVTYYWSGGAVANRTKVVACRNSSFIANNLRIDRIWIGWKDITYFDDLNFTISDSYTPGGGGGGGYGCGIDMSPYNEKTAYTSQPDSIDWFVSGKKYLETKYIGRAFSTQIWGVSLLIDYLQYARQPAPAYYSLNLNGMPLGPPDCISLYGDDITYMMMWDLRTHGVFLTDENPLFQFYCFNGWNMLYKYWVQDFNFMATRAHDSALLGENDVLDGGLVYVGTALTYLPIKFWYGTLTVIPESSGFDDSIETSFNSYQQYASDGRAIDMLYKINSTASLGVTTYIQIWKNGTMITDSNQNIPYTIPAFKFTGQKSYVPLIGGTYKLCLHRGVVNVSTKTVTVTNISNDDYVLYSTNNPADKGSSYIIGYRYYNGEGKNGLINVFYASDSDHFANFDYAQVLNQIISVNTSGNITIPTIFESHVAIMYINQGGLTYQEVKRFYETCGSDILENSIDVTGNDPRLILNGEAQYRANVVGHHIFNSGFDVYVTRNGKRVYPSGFGLSNDFAFWNNITVSGGYNFSLWIATTNGSTRLDSVEITVLTEDDYYGGGDEYGFIVNMIPVQFRLYVGIGFIVFMLMLPTIIVASLQKKLPTIAINVPAIVLTFASITTGFLGFIMTVFWGLLSWIWFFAFLFTLIVILALLYYSGHKGGAGGNATS